MAVRMAVPVSMPGVGVLVPVSMTHGASLAHGEASLPSRSAGQRCELAYTLALR
jgi:hypothetical protein